MKKKKLNLNELHVKSFITETKANSVKGGATEGCGNTFDYCNTVPVNQCNIASYNAACPTVPVQDCNVNVTYPFNCALHTKLDCAINITNNPSLNC